MTGDAHLIDLASRALGGSVLVANDETYAENENLIKVSAPVLTAATTGPRGQIHDGWETRRRDEGADRVILRLGVPGVVRRAVVDTAHFIGDFPADCDVNLPARRLAGPARAGRAAVPARHPRPPGRDHDAAAVVRGGGVTRPTSAGEAAG